MRKNCCGSDMRGYSLQAVLWLELGRTSLNRSLWVHPNCPEISIASAVLTTIYFTVILLKARERSYTQREADATNYAEDDIPSRSAVQSMSFSISDV